MSHDDQTILMLATQDTIRAAHSHLKSALIQALPGVDDAIILEHIMSAEALLKQAMVDLRPLVYGGRA